MGIFSKRPHLRSKAIQRSICLRNAPWLPPLVSRSPGQSVMHCRGPTTVNQRSNCLEIPYGYHIWKEEPLTKVLCISVVKVGVNQRLNLLEISFGCQIFDWKNPDQIAHCYGSKVMQRSVGGNQQSNCLEIPNDYQIW